MKDEMRKALSLALILCIWFTVLSIIVRDTAFRSAKAGAIEGAREWRESETTTLAKTDGVYTCERCGWQFGANVKFHFCPLCGRRAT